MKRPTENPNDKPMHSESSTGLDQNEFGERVVGEVVAHKLPAPAVVFDQLEDFPSRIENSELSRMGVPDLQNMLSFMGLDTEGKKYQLIKRLNDFWIETGTSRPLKRVRFNFEPQ